VALMLVEAMVITTTASAGGGHVPVHDESAAVWAAQELADLLGQNLASQNQTSNGGSATPQLKLASFVKPRNAGRIAPRVRPLLQASNAGLAVSVGFADNSSTSSNFPVPWQGSSNIVFIGGGSAFHAGAMRLDNTSGSDIVVDKVTVNLGRPGPAFQLWSNFTVPSNGSAILTQTADNNFNTSAASPILTCGQSLAQGETRIPTITVTIGGTDFPFSDTAHVLDTGGFDSSCRGNQSLAWRSIGTTGIERPSATLHLASENAPHDVGTATTFTATLTDAADQPLSNASVSLNVLNGPNTGKSASGTTDAFGVANIQYTSTAQGVDLAQATITNASTATLNSEQASTTWISAEACTAPAATASAAKLIYVGQTSGSFGDRLRVAALLTDGAGQPLAGRSLALMVGGTSLTATTDSNGVGSTTVTPDIGQTAVSISFAGDSNFSAAQVSSTIAIQPKATLLRYTGNSLLGSTGPQGISALLTDSLGKTPIANRTVTFSVGTTQATATTDTNGIASTTITFPANQAVGPGQLTISFGGDADYKSSSRVVPIEIYLTTSFVIWGGNSGGLKVGTDVNFWGAQWAKQVTSGNFSANNSFKGFASPVSSIQQCQPNADTTTLTQGCWNGSPGNSGTPPSSLPSFIEVIVSTAITKQGSAIFGNTACGAVLKVDANPGYGPDPGHPGFGVITAVNGDCAGVFPKPAVLTAKQTQVTPVLPQQQVPISASISNSGATDATNATLNETFDGLIPANATQSFTTIPAGQSVNASFQTSVPAIPARQSVEGSTDYETRLGGLDGRLFTASGELTFTDIFQQLYQPLDFSSFSTLQIPRLSVGVTGPACIVPGSQVPYQLTTSNIGSATATQGTATVTLPDGTTKNLSVPQVLASASFAGSVQWQAPAIKAKDPNESTATYLARLTAADNVTVPPTTASVNWQDAQSNQYGAVDAQVSSVKERLPIVSLAPSAPVTILPNQAASANFAVTNTGGGNAIQANILIKQQGRPDIAVPAFSLPAGQSATPTGILRLPSISLEGAQETDAQYLSRLQALDNQKLLLDANLSWSDKAGNVYGPTSNPFSTTEVLPILTIAATGPATAKPADNIAYTITLQNIGHADAAALNITVAMPDGSVQHPLTGTTALAGATIQTTANFTVPKTQAAGPAVATIRLGWTDAAGNSYGFESATVTTTIVAQTVTISDFTPKQGPTGTAVSILGNNLSVPAGPATVFFAGPNNTQLSAKINFASSTQLAVVVPDGAVTGNIQVTNPTGTATSAAPFTVGPRQDFTVTVSPGTATVPQSSTTSFVVAVTSAQTSFTQMASLSVAGLPQGVATAFTPTQITAGANSTLALDLGAVDLQPGNYSFTIHAKTTIDGKQQDRTATATLNVIKGGQTTLAGQVVSTSNEPIVGATVSLDGQSVLTDTAGRFFLVGIQAGTNRPLSVDGHSAFSPNATFPLIFEPATVIAGRANVIPNPFHLPPIDTSQEVTIDPTRDTVAGNAAVQNLQMTIPKGAHLRTLDGTLVSRTSITPLAPDRTPAPLPSDVGTNIVYTSQPGGAITDIPIPVVYPNLAGLDPGTRVELYAFDHAHVNWFVYGFGRVSTDGRTIAPEINPATGKPYGLPDFSWHFPNTGPNGNPSDPNGCPGSTGPHPVDYSTGTKIERVSQVSWGGARGGLSFSLVYTTDKAQNCDNCPFGRGWTHNWDIRLTGSFAPGGAGRMIMPQEVTGRLFSSSGTDSTGAARFTSTATTSVLGGAVLAGSATTQYRDSDGTTLNFNSSGRLVSKVDRNGNATRLSYSNGNLTTITDPVGRSLTFTYDGANRVSSMTDPLGHTWHYTYEGTPGVAGTPGLTTITDPAGNVTKYTYVTGGRIVAVTDPRGNTAKQIAYDTGGRVASQTFADGGTETYNYGLSGTIVTQTTITSTVGRTETRRFDGNGYALSVTDNQGQTSTITRDLTTSLPIASVGPCGCGTGTRTFSSSGSVTSATDASGARMLFGREPVFDLPVQVTDPLGHVTNLVYDTNGNLLSFTNALNQTTTFTYNSFGELVSIRDPLGNSRRIEYDDFGAASTVVDALGNRATFTHDILGRTLTSTDPLGHHTGFQYDQRGQIAQYTDAAGAANTFAYDENGNLTSTTNVIGQTTLNQYDAKNRVVSVTDSIGRITKLSFTTDNELKTITAPSGRSLGFATDAGGLLSGIADPSSASLTFTHDSFGRMTSLTDQRGNSATVAYDAIGRPISRTDALGNTSTRTYDLIGNLTQTTDRFGRSTSITHDALNRISTVSYPDSFVAYTYDANGRTTRVDDSQSGFVEFVYDANGQVLSETTAAGTVRYAYDASGRVISVTPNGRPSIQYSYDSAGRLASISQGTDTFTYGYDNLSRRISLQRPNGITTSYAFDGANRLTRLTHINAAGQTLEDFNYTFDQDDRIVGINSLSSPTLLPASATAARADANNRVTQFGAMNFAFNDLGQTLTRTNPSGSIQYEWDSRGRVTQATLPTGQTVTYSYDPLGRLAARAVNGVTTQFLYTGREIVLDMGSDGTIVDYTNGTSIDDKLRQSSTQTGPLYFLQDHLGSTIALTGADGSVLEREQYEPFGFSSGSAFTRYGYTGRELDPSTGLLFYRARWYDPQQGRFLSEDPAGLAGGSPNFYTYGNGDPINARDPSGEFINLVTGLVGAAIGAGVGALATTAGTLIFSGRLPTGAELAKGTISGAVTGGLIGLAGPLAAPLAGALGGGVVGAIGSGAIIGGVAGAIGGAAGQGAANLIDPCHPGSIGKAALLGGLTGAVAGGAVSGISAGLSSGASTTAEDAINSARPTPGAAQPTTGAYPNFNPTGGTTNCGACSDAVDSYLAGNGLNPAASGPEAWPTTPGTAPWNFTANPGSIENGLQAAGDGARGIVYVTDGSAAHVFNAVNNAGTVVAIDGQVGVMGTIGDVAANAGYTGSSISWGWLPTFP
jgi:RHS repeat-associated protein/uncharacterized repeat protein (TIGR01451 family)